jgi:hypothetical protein
MQITKIEDKNLTIFWSQDSRETTFILEEETDYIHLYQEGDMIGIPKSVLKDLIKILKDSK